MRALAIVVVLCAIARAAPNSADLIAAERAWEAADKERDAARSVPLWEAAAKAYDAAVATAGRHKADAAQFAVLAWRNAIARADAAKPERDLALLASLEVYEPFAPAAELPGLLFSRGVILFKRDELAESIPILEDIVTRFPSDPTAEHAASLLLDALNRRRDLDGMAAWVAKMRAMPKLLAKRRDLVETLARLHVQILRGRAEAQEAAGEFLACAASYREAARGKPDRKDELLFNAGVCFERGGAAGSAIAAYREAARLKTRLAPAAKAAADRLKPPRP